MSEKLRSNYTKRHKKLIILITPLTLTLPSLYVQWLFQQVLFLTDVMLLNNKMSMIKTRL